MNVIQVLKEEMNKTRKSMKAQTVEGNELQMEVSLPLPIPK